MIARAHLVAGLGLGDEGKGSVVDWLVRQQRADTVVRYNGGAQAAHHVVTTDGREHCCAQFSAGTLTAGVRTFLSRFTIVDLLALTAEERALCALGIQDGFSRLTIDPRCVIATPFHRIVNHMRELARGVARHGSCGMGIGEARLDSERDGLPSLTVADARVRERARKRLQLIWMVKLDQAEQLQDEHPENVGLSEALADLRRPDRVDALADAYAELLCESGVRVAPEPEAPHIVIFEGAQGVLLDRDLGFWPHVTPSRTTFVHAETLLCEWGMRAREATRIGVLRAYATRHGAGPLVTEDPWLSEFRPDRHNGVHPWQGRFRLGWFDAVAARYALGAVGGVDRLVLTNLDRLDDIPTLRVCHEYIDESGQSVTELPAASERARSRARTAWLNACRPRYREYPGWRQARVRPVQLDAFLDGLQAPTGLGRDVSALSFGPTAADKFLLPGAGQADD